MPVPASPICGCGRDGKGGRVGGDHGIPEFLRSQLARRGIHGCLLGMAGAGKDCKDHQRHETYCKNRCNDSHSHVPPEGQSDVRPVLFFGHYLFRRNTPADIISFVENSVRIGGASLPPDIVIPKILVRFAGIAPRLAGSLQPLDSGLGPT